MQRSSASASPLLGLIVLICFVAAIIDAVYWKRGGQKTPKKIVREFQFILLGLALLTAVLSFLFNGAVAGDVLGPSLDLVFIGWEWQRYKIRRDNPLGVKTTSVPPPPPLLPPPATPGA